MTMNDNRMTEKRISSGRLVYQSKKYPELRVFDETQSDDLRCLVAYHEDTPIMRGYEDDGYEYFLSQKVDIFPSDNYETCDLSESLFIELAESCVAGIEHEGWEHKPSSGVYTSKTIPELTVTFEKHGNIDRDVDFIASCHGEQLFCGSLDEVGYYLNMDTGKKYGFDEPNVMRPLDYADIAKVLHAAEQCGEFIQNKTKNNKQKGNPEIEH